MFTNSLANRYLKQRAPKRLFLRTEGASEIDLAGFFFEPARIVGTIRRNNLRE